MSHSNYPWLSQLGIGAVNDGVFCGHHSKPGDGEILESFSPIQHEKIASVTQASQKDVIETIMMSDNAFRQWSIVPAPRRGELVRLYAQELRQHKITLGKLITLESGKIRSEAEGEVQEMIDICDFAVGLSRQLYGLTIVSERPEHRLMEQWHPKGPVAIITAFNFPVAVWAWNAALALVCGDSIIWKPSEKTPLCAIACQYLLNQVTQNFPEAPDGLSSLLIGSHEVGQTLSQSAQIPLVSATGSTRMGKEVAQEVAKRLGQYLLELGGNNAMIVTPSADLELACRAILFSAVGTAGQRCTSLRRLIIHQSVADQLIAKLQLAYSSLKIGDPNEDEILIGPLIDEAAVLNHHHALALAEDQGGRVYKAGDLSRAPETGHYVEPAMVEIHHDADIVMQETFSPILYVMRYDHYDEAIQWHNEVPQGLSSAMFTEHIRDAERFLSSAGSDCGIANINIGTSGAEIGGAFGGEKETGGGRESGSDAWKNYMRRATNTINYGQTIPLAQGVEFG